MTHEPKHEIVTLLHRKEYYELSQFFNISQNNPSKTKTLCLCRGILGLNIYILTIIYRAMPAINKSSTRVTQVIGTLNTVPKQAQGICSLLRIFKYTPIAPTDITTKTVQFVRFGFQFVIYAKAKASSMKGYNFA